MVVRPDPEPPTGAGPSAIRRLVVPLDGSVRAAQALPVAAALAERLGVPVGLVTVVDPARALPPALASDLAAGGEFTDGILIGLRYDAQQALNWGAAALAHAGTAPRPDYVRLVQGPTVACLAEAVGEGDMVVMTSRGRGRRHGRLAGSVTEAFIRRVRVPILVLHASTGPEVVVAAHDEVPRRARARPVDA